MRLWHTKFDAVTRSHRHALAKGYGHSVLAALEPYVFRSLGVSAAVWEDGTEWFPLHLEPSVATFERQHGMDTERGGYNERLLTEAVRRRRSVRGEHAGHSDFFVPMVARNEVIGVLVAGPCALARPTSEAVRSRWRWLTGREADVADPELASYLSASLATLVLEGNRVSTFRRLLERCAALFAGEGRADALANEIERLRVELDPARYADRIWGAVQSMTDERSSNAWQSAHNVTELTYLGLRQPADHVLVGLVVPKSGDLDPLEQAIRIDSLQRDAVALGRSTGDTMAGRVGGHGVVFLSAAGAPGPAARRKVSLLARRASDLARERYGLTLCFGVDESPDTGTLSHGYEAALGAAENALAQGRDITFSETGQHRAPGGLGRHRKDLVKVAEERPQLLAVRFDRYMEAAAQYCGYRLDATRAHLDIGFELLADSLVDRGVLDERNAVSLREGLRQASDGARTLEELFAEHRRAIDDLAQAALRPVPARQDYGLRRALDYIHRHYTEPLRLETVARVAGFAPTYFSTLFAKRQHTMFSTYVLGLRIERARHLLGATEIDVARVAELSGFGTPQYFSAVFRRFTGTTPLSWRREPHRVAAVRGARTKRKQ